SASSTTAVSSIRQTLQTSLAPIQSRSSRAWACSRSMASVMGLPRQISARIERQLLAHLLVYRLGLRRVGLGQYDLQLHVLVAWLLARQTTPAQAQFLS